MMENSQPSRESGLSSLISSAVSQDFSKVSRPHPFEEFVKSTWSGYDYSTIGSFWYEEVGQVWGDADRAVREAQHLAAEIALKLATDGGLLRHSWLDRLLRKSEGLRPLYVPSSGYQPPSIVVLDPEWRGPPERLTNKIIINDRTEETLVRIAKNPWALDVSEGASMFIRKTGPSGLRNLLGCFLPEVIVARKPRMQRLCAPWPTLEVECDRERSTVGIFCRDQEGKLGVTACFHGTGRPGTSVQIGLRTAKVAAANEIQDIVFIPVGDGYNIPGLRGSKGLHPDRSPAVLDRAWFCGSTSGEMETRIISFDAYVFRNRPSNQLKVQTLPNTNTGDSGAALISDNDEVIGFAFERTAFGEFPEMTDWIWAPNALRSLCLTPLKSEHAE